MIGITEITKKVADQSKVSINRNEVEKIIKNFIGVLQDSLKKNQAISIKGHFTLKRAQTKPKGNNKCDIHIRSMNEIRERIKRTKGDKLSAYISDPGFKSLVKDTKNCRNCQQKKVQLLKSSKLLDRAIFKTSKGFWGSKSKK